MFTFPIVFLNFLQYLPSLNLFSLKLLRPSIFSSLFSALAQRPLRLCVIFSLRFFYPLLTLAKTPPSNSPSESSPKATPQPAPLSPSTPTAPSHPQIPPTAPQNTSHSPVARS